MYFTDRGHRGTRGAARRRADHQGLAGPAPPRFRRSQPRLRDRRRPPGHLASPARRRRSLRAFSRTGRGACPVKSDGPGGLPNGPRRTPRESATAAACLPNAPRVVPAGRASGAISRRALPNGHLASAPNARGPGAPQQPCPRRRACERWYGSASRCVRPAKIWEDPGFWEDPVCSSTPNTPASPNPPRKWRSSRTWTWQAGATLPPPATARGTRAQSGGRLPE